MHHILLEKSVPFWKYFKSWNFSWDPEVRSSRAPTTNTPLSSLKNFINNAVSSSLFHSSIFTHFQALYAFFTAVVAFFKSSQPFFCEISDGPLIGLHGLNRPIGDGSTIGKNQKDFLQGIFCTSYSPMVLIKKVLTKLHIQRSYNNYIM